MIVIYDEILGFVTTIVFHFPRVFSVIVKSKKTVLGYCRNALGFSYLAIPTRHEVSGMPLSHGVKSMFWNYCRLD